MNNQFSHPFNTILKEYRKFGQRKTIMASNIAINEFKDNFKRQGYQGDTGRTIKWKKRKLDKTPRDKTRAVLVKTGRLRRGLMVKPDKDYARVINRVPYAQLHNEGFKGMVKIKAHTRYRYSKTKAKTGKKTKSGKDKTRTVKTRSLAIRVKAHSRKVNMPARPFMRHTLPLMRKIDKMIETELKKIFK